MGNSLIAYSVQLAHVLFIDVLSFIYRLTMIISVVTQEIQERNVPPAQTVASGQTLM